MPQGKDWARRTGSAQHSDNYRRDARSPSSHKISPGDIIDL